MNKNLTINGLNPIFWDIETTGLSAVQDKFVLADFYFLKEDEIVTIYELDELVDFVKNNINGILVGFNTENYRGGFDIPFLRFKFLKEGLDYPFMNIKHLDMTSIVEKFINTNTTYVKPPSKSSLVKEEVQEIAFLNNVEYTTKKQTLGKLYESFENGVDIDWNNKDKRKTTSKNDLQSAYQFLFDEDATEDYIDGAEMPKLYRKGDIDTIKYHCDNDVRRLAKVTDGIIPMIPEYYLNRSITVL